ncbi:MAG: hypothetical protein ACKOTF_16830 [Opitutaceae bacterium]
MRTHTLVTVLALVTACAAPLTAAPATSAEKPAAAAAAAPNGE